MASGRLYQGSRLTKEAFRICNHFLQPEECELSAAQHEPLSKPIHAEQKS